MSYGGGYDRRRTGRSGIAWQNKVRAFAAHIVEAVTRDLRPASCTPEIERCTTCHARSQ
jgi:hypothetical protein